MHARLLARSVAPLFAASLVALAAPAAHAQAPGEQLDAPAEDAAPEADEAAVGPAAQPVVVAAPDAAPVVAPSMARTIVVTPAAAPCGVVRVAARESVMANRWSVGLSIGSMSLAPDGSDHQTGFGIGELALRFRATPHFELEASAGGGRQQLDNGDQGDLQVNTVALAVRYRFMPESKWNVFAMAGLGAASVTLHDATQQERDDATHPLAMLGVGVERRFHHFALQAELRAVGISDKSSNDPMTDPAPVAMPAATVAPITTSATQKQSGGSFTLGASYYF